MSGFCINISTAFCSRRVRKIDQPTTTYHITTHLYNMPVIRTTHHSGLLETDDATALYTRLQATIPWEDGIFSRRAGKVTRKAHAFTGDGLLDAEDEIQLIVMRILSLLGLSYEVEGIYVNYYRDGNDWAPAHSHAGQVQLVISLGATRQLKVGEKVYNLANGDVIVFGSSTHEVVRDPAVTAGRISIATFMKPMK